MARWARLTCLRRRGRLMKCHSMLFVTPDTWNTQFKNERENNAKGSRDHRAKKFLNLLHNYTTFFTSLIGFYLLFFGKISTKKILIFFVFRLHRNIVVSQKRWKIGTAAFFLIVIWSRSFSHPVYRRLTAKPLPREKTRRTRYILN